ncbi:hypothetical protein BsWGS_17033 [Bradybaena similaris]
MDESTQQPSCGAASHQEYPTRDRIVMPKRFNPRQRLEEKMRQRMQRETETAQPAPEHLLPVPPTSLDRGVPTMLAPVQVPGSKNAPPKKPPRRGLVNKENALTTSVPRTQDWAGDERSSSVPRTQDWAGGERSSSVPRTPDWAGDERSSSVPRTPDWAGDERSSSVPRTPDWAGDEGSSSVPRTPDWAGDERSSSVPRTPNWAGDESSSSVPRTPDWAGDERSSRICCTELPSKSGQANDSASPLRNRIVLPKRFNPRAALQAKMARGMEKEAEATVAPPLHGLYIKQIPRRAAAKHVDRSHRALTLYVDLPLEEDTVPRHLPRRQSTSKLQDFTTSRLQRQVVAEWERQLISDGAAAAEASEYSSQWKQPAETLYDEFCTSASVARLTQDNYMDFLGDKRSALVMFYKPWKHSCVKGRKHFVKAAESNKNPDAVFAAVDCSVQEDLCLHEDITFVPTFKLYSQGQVVNTIKDFIFFNSFIMKKFVERAPALTQDGVAKPSCRTEQSWLKKAIQKLKH